MKLARKLYWGTAGLAASLFFQANAFAQSSGFKLNDIKGTSGAGSKDLTDLTKKGEATAQSFADFLIIGFAFAGLLIFGISLYALYKAGKDERESPKGAIWGLVIGAAMTAVTLILGLTRNTFGI